MSEKIKLGYWNIRGLGQPIRLLLEYAQIPYEEKRYQITAKEGGGWDLGDWLSVKKTLGLDLPNLPWLQDGDLKITQTNAILLYLAEKSGLHGKSPEQRAIANCFLGHSWDLRDPLVKLVYSGAPEEYEEAKKKYLATLAPKKLDMFEQALKKRGGPFILGTDITFVDLLWFDLLEQLQNLHDELVSSRPTINEFVKHIRSLPQVDAYYRSDRFIDHPYNNVMAHFK